MTSVIPPRSLNPSPNNIVADLAASPGIKTCLLAQEMNNQGTIIALEKAKSGNNVGYRLSKEDLIIDIDFRNFKDENWH